MDALTDREHEILTMMARGMRNDDIAERLFLSVATVKTHVARVLRKLGARDRTQAVVAAYDLGIVRPRGSQPAARRVELILDWG
jgi:DNA-binding NarL/FixJ family response regulator